MISRSFGRPTAFLARISAGRSSVHISRSKASNRTDTSLTCWKSPSPKTSPSRSTLPRSVERVKSIPFLRVASSQTNGRLSGKSRSLGWKGANAPTSFWRFSRRREKHTSMSRVVCELPWRIADQPPMITNSTPASTSAPINLGKFNCAAGLRRAPDPPSR